MISNFRLAKLKETGSRFRKASEPKCLPWKYQNPYFNEEPELKGIKLNKHFKHFNKEASELNGINSEQNICLKGEKEIGRAHV